MLFPVCTGLAQAKQKGALHVVQRSKYGTKRLKPEDLRRTFDPAEFGFATTDEIADPDRHPGQGRAIEAVTLSVRMQLREFNAYVLGSEGFGRHRAVHRILEAEKKNRPAPPDWVYVNNFETPHRPRALKLPPGSAVVLKRAMQDMIDDLGNDIPALFASDEYQTQRRVLDQEFGGRHEAELGAFAEKARAEDVALIRTPLGFVLAAIVDGNVIEPAAFEKLDEKTRKEIEEKIGRLQEDLAKVLRNAPKLEREHRQRLIQLHAEMAERTVSERLAEVAQILPADPALKSHLEAVRQDIIDNAELFLGAAGGDGGDGPFPGGIVKYHLLPEFERYQVNVMISHPPDEEAGAPVVEEDLPSMAHIVGRIEHVSDQGALTTNFTLIKPGCLHRANGGFLVIDASRILSEPFAWDALKRCLKSREIAITSMADRVSLISTLSLEPEPIPLDVRVILIGDRRLHWLLSLLDPEFQELFKIQADFETDMPRNLANATELAAQIAVMARQKDLRPINAPAVARLLDEAVRHAGDATKLTLETSMLNDLACEADHYAGTSGRATIQLADVQRAIDMTEKRTARLRQRMQEAILRDTILIRTDSAVTGQINGLSVYDLGRTSFGRPSRITARARMGTGKLIDIEREVELGGPLHSKGVLILSGYLSANYARDVPISLHASIVFEQSYGGIDGDSASSAELYALLSALSGVPILQAYAVTGSVNQHGEVQAIGGVNEKIEGFFDICNERGLTGDQGVLIPAANIEHLMVHPKVVDAVRAGTFSVIPVSTIDEGIEILTGKKAGKRGRNGEYPKGSVNALVEATLRDYARARRAFGMRDPSESKT